MYYRKKYYYCLLKTIISFISPSHVMLLQQNVIGTRYLLINAYFLYLILFGAIQHLLHNCNIHSVQRNRLQIMQVQRDEERVQVFCATKLLQLSSFSFLLDSLRIQVSIHHHRYNHQSRAQPEGQTTNFQNFFTFCHSTSY